MKNILEPYQISDGTLRLLAFIAALFLGDLVVAFEEPENCIHPWLLKTLIHLCKNIAPCQIIITTHSPYLLDKVNPEDILVVEKLKVKL